MSRKYHPRLQNLNPQSALSRVLLTILTLFASCSLGAEMVKAVTEENVAYFLFAAPNKIARFDLAGQQPLEDIALAKVPTALAIEDGVAYVAFHSELHTVDLATGEATYIRNFLADIHAVVALNGLLYVIQPSGSWMDIVDAVTGTVLGSYEADFSGTNYLPSPVNQALLYRSADYFSSDLRALALDAGGLIDFERASPHDGNYSSGQELFLNTSENKLYDNAGFIYYAADFRYAGSLGGTLDALTFIGDNAIAARAETLDLFDAAARPIGQKGLGFAADYLAANGDTVLAFAFGGSDYQWQAVDVTSFEPPEPREPVDPNGLVYDPEFISAGGDSYIYLTDLQTLSVFTYGLAERGYTASWPLRNPPTWVTHSPVHARLYLGYDNGQITYFDTTQEQPKEQPLVTLATRVVGLEAAGDYLFAADEAGNPGGYHLLDATGNIAGSSNWSIQSGQYVYNPALSRIYSIGGPFSLFWNDFDAETGRWVDDGESPYFPGGNVFATTPPLILSDDHQYLLNGAGQILDAISLNQLNALPGPIRAGTWIADQLVTVAADGGALQFWSEEFTLFESNELPGGQAGQKVTLLAQGGFLTMIVQGDEAPQFNQYDINNLPDRDEDAVHDLADNCLDAANTDQADFDNDGVGDACDDDDDNDTLLDTVELAWGLDPLQPDDANADFDGDNVSNALEIRLGTDPSDPDSFPEPISNLVETFDDGFPQRFYTSSGALPWTISSAGGVDDSGALRSANLSGDEVSEISFTGFFEESALSVNLRFEGEGASWTSVALIVDGEVIDIVSGVNGWHPTHAALQAGLHTITLRASKRTFVDDEASFALVDNLIVGKDSDGDGFPDQQDLCPLRYDYDQADFDGDGIGDACDPNPFEPNERRDYDEDGLWDFQDNCPEAFNPDQSDVDNDAIGDACDPRDNRPVDSDMDGVIDQYDSCPNVANPEQSDFDQDGIGDVCDADIDGDGITNDIEQGYDFLDPYIPEDGRQDFDEDGVNNAFEIANNTDPAVFDVFETVDLLGYYPLREGQYLFADTSTFYSYTTYYLEALDEYADVFHSGAVNRYQRRADGIYLTSQSDGDGLYASRFENYLFMPASLKLGEAVQVEAVAHGQDKGYLTAISITHQLVGVGEREFGGEWVPSVTIKTRVIHDNGFHTVKTTIYLKGVGLGTFNGVPLQEVHLTPAEPESNPQSPNEDNNGEQEYSAPDASGGSAEVFLLLILSVLGLFVSLKKPADIGLVK